MASYIKGLRADVTMGEVFDDVYSRVDAELTALNRLRAVEGNSSPRVPATDLLMRFGGSTDEADNWNLSNGVAVYSRGECANLVSTTFRVEPGGINRPIGVRASRGNELSGDYSLYENEMGIITCRLGQMGLWGTGNETDDPIGSFRSDRAEAVRTLLPVDQARVTIVAERILENLGLVELLKEGEDVDEVLAMVGRTAELQQY